jgi:CRP-like cAMP-binding protein
MQTVTNTGNRLLASLPSDVLASLQSDLKQESRLQGAVLLEPGDSIERIYFPETGMVSLLVALNDGSTVETSTVGREGAVGLTAGLGTRRWMTRAVIQIPGMFSSLHASRLQQVASSHSVVRDMIARYTEVQWAEAQQLTACNARHDAASRLCRWIVQCSDRIGSESIPLTQEFLAQMLGVRRTTVTLLAQSMQTRGLIKYARGRIVILNRAAIEARACECYRVVQQDQLPVNLGFKL